MMLQIATTDRGRTLHNTTIRRRNVFGQLILNNKPRSVRDPVTWSLFGAFHFLFVLVGWASGQPLACFAGFLGIVGSLITRWIITHPETASG